VHPRPHARPVLRCRSCGWRPLRDDVVAHGAEWAVQRLLFICNFIPPVLTSSPTFTPAPLPPLIRVRSVAERFLQVRFPLRNCERKQRSKIAQLLIQCKLDIRLVSRGWRSKFVRNRTRFDCSMWSDCFAPRSTWCFREKHYMNIIWYTHLRLTTRWRYWFSYEKKVQSSLITFEIKSNWSRFNIKKFPELHFIIFKLSLMSIL
jgi:hypothetical protein